jgi:adhesin/invasin
MISEGTEPAPRAGMPSMLRFVRGFLPATAGLAILACGGGGVVLPSEGVAAKIAIVSGNNQAGVVGGALTDNLTVRVTDSQNRPVQNQQVTFSAGDANSGQAVPPTALTNADGVAGVKWVLGTVAGTQTMLAKPTGNGAPANLSASFSATATTAAIAKLEKTAGDNQSATAGSAVAIPPAVKVTDANGNPVAGVGVTFAVGSGGGSINPTTPVITNAGGVAALTSWTLGITAGTNTLTATISGTGIVGNPATFTATGQVGSAGKLAILRQPSATAQSGVAFAQQPKVQLEDAGGNPVATAGLAITAALASGTGGTLGGQLTVATDNKGAATFTNLSISGAQGAYTISFSNPNVTGVTSSTVTLAAGAPAQLAITVEPPSSAQNGAVLAPPIQVQLEDAQGNAVAPSRASTSPRRSRRAAPAEAWAAPRPS